MEDHIDRHVTLAVAACFVTIYLAITFSDDGSLARFTEPVTGGIPDVVAFLLALVPPAVTCGAVLVLRRRPAERALLCAVVAAALTAAGVVVGFVLLFFVGVAS